MSNKIHVICFLFLLFLSLVLTKKIKRCCKTGGLIIYKNGTISCTPAVLPDVLNEEPLLLSVTLDQAMKNFKNDSANFVCREIVFDEKTGLVKRSLINISMTASLEFKKLPTTSYEVKKCCNDDSYFEFNATTGQGCCVQREDKQRYEYVIQKFQSYYKDDRTYDCYKLNCSNLFCNKDTCHDYYFLNDQLNIYVLGNEILEVMF